MVTAVLEYGGHKVRGSELFETDTPIAMTKKFFKGLKVELLTSVLHYIYIYNTVSVKVSTQ